MADVTQYANSLLNATPDRVIGQAAMQIAQLEYIKYKIVEWRDNHDNY